MHIKYRKKGYMEDFKMHKILKKSLN